MPLTKAALAAIETALGQATLQHAIVAEEKKELAALLEHFGAVSRGGDCNHCLIWKTESPKSAYYRALKVLAENDDKGTTPQELAQQALLTWKQLDRVLNDFELGNVALMRRQLWFARGCTCDLPF